MPEYVHEISQDEAARIARFLKLVAAGTVLFLVLLVLLFAYSGTWLRLISPEAERRFVEPYLDWSSGTLLIDAEPELQDYVESLTLELYAQLDNPQPLEVRVIAGDTVNAFAVLGGYVFIFEGLMNAVNDENSLAMVLAHEIAHVHNRDPLLATGRGLLISMAISTLSGSGMDPANVEVGSELFLNVYSREQELAADELALAMLQGHYGHVGGANSLFESLERTAAPDDMGNYGELLSTHPLLQDRIERIDALSLEQGWTAGETRPYPDAISAALEE